MGLSPGEVRVYEALLATGPSSTNKIHEKTGIERRNIYDILNKLIDRGLVTYIEENKKRTFHLASPEKLVDYLEEKESDLEQIKSELKQELPAMREVFQQTKPSLSAEVYRGAEGIKTIWQDMLNHKEVKEIFWFGSGGYVPRKLPTFWHHWNKKRLQRKIESYHLYRTEMKGQIPEEVGKVKCLPKEFSGAPTVICVYGNRVVNFLFGEDLFAFVIESKELADNYRAYHHYLWENVASD